MIVLLVLMVVVLFFCGFYKFYIVFNGFYVSIMLDIMVGFVLLVFVVPC